MMKITKPENLETILSALEEIKAGPKGDELEAAPLLEFWSAVMIEDVPRLVGIVIGHPLLPREEIVTSSLLYISTDRTFARTMSRWYRLGPRDVSNRARLDRSHMKPFNLKRLPNYRRMLGVEAEIAAMRFADRSFIERAFALGRRLSRG